MENSGIESNFQFVSYKISEFSFTMEKQLPLLMFNGYLNQDMFNINVGIKQPLYFESEKTYVCGIVLKVQFTPKHSNQENPQDNESKDLLFLEASIDGAFKTKDKFPKEMEQNLVKFHAPTLLFPFLRSTISSFLANAGFGSVLIPLININKVAEAQLKDKEIEIIENKSGQ